MGFLEEYAAVTGETPEQRAIGQLHLIQTWLTERMPALFAELQEHKPNFVAPGFALVTRFADVVEVAGADEVFSVAPYKESMTQHNGGANFMLGMDNSPIYEFEKSAMKLAARRDDLPRIRQYVAATARERAEAAVPSGRLDLAVFGRQIPASFVGYYFGVPGPDTDTLQRWTRRVFHSLFLNFTRNSAILEAGVNAAGELRRFTDVRIAEVKTQIGMGTQTTLDDANTVIERLVRMQSVLNTALTDERIRENLTGAIVGVIDNTVIAVVNTIHVLLDHPEALTDATAAARVDDNPRLLRYVWEALRFGSPAPILLRQCLQDYVLARGTERETIIPAKTLVLAANGAAMLDRTMLPDPETLRIDRPMNHYLHFGWGRHECLGRYVNEVQIVEIVKSLLTRRNLRRAPGDDGQPRFDGPFPSRFVVQFDA